jgi:hypothetical protein
MHILTAHRPARGPSAPGAVARFTLWATLAALLNASWRRLHDTHQRRMTTRPAPKPERLQVWEDEGGQNQMPDAPQ